MLPRLSSSHFISPCCCKNMRWAGDMAGPLLVSSAQHPACFTAVQWQCLMSAAFPARWCARRPIAGGKMYDGIFISAAREKAGRLRPRSSSNLRNAREEREAPADPAAVLASASSTEGDAAKMATRYTIDVDVHPDVSCIAVKHASQLSRFLEHYPISAHTENAYARAIEFVREFHLSRALAGSDEAGEPHQQLQHQLPVVLDSGCGTGRSSALLARAHPHLPVVGVDRSAVRLSKGGGGGGIRDTGHSRLGDGSRKQAAAWRPSDDQSQDVVGKTEEDRAPFARGKGGHSGRESLPSNLLLLRADLVDLWILAWRDRAWEVREHSILYPNPYPKRSQLRSRWHGHPVFPVLLGLGGRITLRSNWKAYLEEVCEAVLAISNEAEELKGEGNATAADQREGGGSNRGSAVDEAGGNGVLPAIEASASVAAAAASYAASARAGPSLFEPAVPAATNFEAKYVAVGEAVYELRLEPRLPR